MTNRTVTYFTIKILLISIFILFSINSHSQNRQENLIYQAKQMANYFKSEDYKSYVKFVSPELIKMVGGAEKMIILIEQQMSSIKNNQMQLEDIILGKPTSIINHSSQLQSSIPQSMIITTSESRITSKYNLIAISNDEGKNWTFLDTSGKDIQTMRKKFPNLSPDILLPAKVVTQE
jgi:hypothetical protein